MIGKGVGLALRRSSGRGRAIMVAGVVAALAMAAVPALAQSQHPFAGLAGTWRGQAQLKLQGGNSETLRCNAYYTPKGEGTELGLAIRCASASNKIELRAQLTANGGKISGRWEERTYNAAGDVTGQSQDGRLTLNIDGGAFKGSMAVKTMGASQIVSIKTEGIALQGVSINLSRG